MLNNPDTFIGRAGKGGSVLEPIPEAYKMCQDPQHNPPNFICIPSGQQLRHTCHTCGAVQIIRSTEITC